MEKGQWYVAGQCAMSVFGQYGKPASSRRCA